MTRLLLLVAGLVVAGEGRRIQINEEVESLVGRDVESLEGREGRGLADWFGWGGSQPTEAPVRRIQGLQRRTSQVEGSFRGPPQPRILVNSKNRQRLRKPEQSKQQQATKARGPSLSKRKLLMPVIISSYASTNIQGHGNEEEELKNTIDSDQIDESNEINKENAFSASQKKSGGVKEEPKTQSVSEEKEAAIRTTPSSPESASTSSPSSSTTTSSSTTSPRDSTASSTTPRPASTAESISSVSGRDEVTTAEVITEYAEERIEEERIEEEKIEEEGIEEEGTEATNTNEVADYEQSPYLPNIPEILDQDRILVLGQELPAVKASERSSESRGSQYLAGYQQIESNKKVRFPGDEETSTERGREERPAPPKQSEPDFYPLGKAPKGKITPQGSPPIGKKQLPRPVKLQPPPKPPVKEPEASSSFFDFFPKFWQSNPTPAPASPVRPIGPRRPPPPARRVPTVTQLEQAPPPADYPAGLAAPLLLKVGSNYPVQETPTRPLTRDPKPNTARIDNRIYTEGEDPFVVLPAAAAPQKKASAPRRGPPPPPRRPSLPKPSGRPFGPAGSRPKKPRLGGGPLPMTSQPVIGLPQVPPSRKQSPFIAKRPQLPPRVPGSNKAFSPPIGPHRKPAKPQKKLLQKPVELRKPILKKSSNPALKPAATVGVQQPSASIPEITLRPNGSNQPGSAIANHLSSLLTSFFSTTVSPARPPAALPSLVEDTEFADVVNGIPTNKRPLLRVRNVNLMSSGIR